jgi:hypothetical protein
MDETAHTGFRDRSPVYVDSERKQGRFVVLVAAGTGTLTSTMPNLCVGKQPPSATTTQGIDGTERSIRGVEGQDADPS